MAWLDGWSKRIELSINDYAGDIGGSVTWFPVTVFLTGSQAEEVFAELTTDEEYLKTQFTEADGTTKLYGEKELFGHTSEYISQYPPAQSGTYVKATSGEVADHEAYQATDPNNSLTGAKSGNQWVTEYLNVDPQRFHIDLGSAKIIKRIYYENSHEAGTYTNRGAKNYILQGSNESSAFEQLTYGTDTDWTTIQASLQFDIHTGSDVADPKYQVITNSVAYRYYAIKIADGWGSTDHIGIRRIELQIEEPIGIFHVSRDGWTINANTSIFLYYDSTHAENGDWIGEIGSETAEKVWNDEYYGVFHLEEASDAQIIDSTSNGVDSVSNTLDTITGKISKGMNNDGSEVANFGVQSFVGANELYTISFCMKAGAQTNKWAIARGRFFDDQQGDIQIRTEANRKLHPHIRFSSGWADFITATSYGDSIWTHITITCDASTLRAYFNGVVDANSVDISGVDISDVGNTNKLLFGAYENQAGDGYEGIFTGDTDEVRISSTNRSAAWVKGEYNSLWNTLFTYGNQEEAPAVAVNAIFWANF